MVTATDFFTFNAPTKQTEIHFLATDILAECEQRSGFVVLGYGYKEVVAPVNDCADVIYDWLNGWDVPCELSLGFAQDAPDVRSGGPDHEAQRYEEEVRGLDRLDPLTRSIATERMQLSVLGVALIEKKEWCKQNDVRFPLEDALALADEIQKWYASYQRAATALMTAMIRAGESPLGAEKAVLDTPLIVNWEDDTAHWVVQATIDGLMDMAAQIVLQEGNSDAR